jgi:hypothetical protein
MAAVLLPVGVINDKPYVYIEFSVPLMAALLVDRPHEAWSSLVFLLQFGIPQLTLAVPISAGYLGWIVTGGLPHWVWRTGYVLAVLGGTAQLATLGWGLFGVFSEPTTLDAGLSLYLSCGFAALALGAWLLIRNRRRDLPHALNALIALQVVYVAGVLPPLLVSLLAHEVGFDHVHSGGHLALVTVVVYAVQMVLGSRQRRARV